MIAEIQANTLFKLLPLAEAFATEANYPGGFSPTAFKAGWTPLLASGVGRILAVEEKGEVVGALGMAFMPDMYSGVSTATELFWFVGKAHRKTSVGVDLFDEFERQGRIHRVGKLVMVHLEKLTPEKLKAFYESRGYVKVEETYWKLL